MQQHQRLQRLLGEQDPNPIEFFNSDGKLEVLLVCEHAGKQVPQKLGRLGLAQADLDKHVGWDIGAAAVTRKLSTRLNAPAILQRYSRLVIDCNRPPEAQDAMAKVADEIVIPGNQNLDLGDRELRKNEIFLPFHDAVDQAISSKRFQLVLSIHSFNPVLTGVQRPWPLAFLFRGDAETPNKLAEIIGAQQPRLTIGMNQPYQIDDESDWFVPKHGEKNKIAHSLIEIRNDGICDENGQDFWADQLANAVLKLLEEKR